MATIEKSCHLQQSLARFYTLVSTTMRRCCLQLCPLVQRSCKKDKSILLVLGILFCFVCLGSGQKL